MDWILLILGILLIILLGYLSYYSRSAKRGGSERHRLIAVSSPIGTASYKDKKAKILKLSDYNTNDFDEDRLVKDINRFISKRDVVIIGNIRGDQTRIKPDLHVHAINLDLTDVQNPYTFIAENKPLLMSLYGINQKQWDKYWDDLCHMDIHEFRSIGITGGDALLVLSRDYNRFLTTLARINVIKQDIPDNKKQYEAINALERWTLSMLNADKDPWHPTVDNDATNKMIEEFKEKGLYPNKEHEAVLKILATTDQDPKDYTPRLQDDIVSYGKYKSNVDPARLARMIDKTDLATTTAALMRYTALVGGSQQWMVPASVYRKLHDKYKIDIEGFASSINSQIMSIGGEFCSIFPEDKPFGSLGNFWDLDLNGKRIIINSPFVEPLMDRLADHLERQVPELALVVVPSWKDAKFYKKLETLANQKFELQPGTYDYEDVRGKKITARFPSTWFIIGESSVEREDII